MNILLVTDAWRPQVNGVVRTLEEVTARLEALGHHVRVVAPDQFRTLPLPSYPEIRLSLALPGALRRIMGDFGPDQVHIATEGPLGWAARAACLSKGIGFTTSYHTRFPEYLRARLPVPVEFTYAALRRFHNSGIGCLVATKSIEDELRARGFVNLVRWTRGVDQTLYRPRPGDGLAEAMGWKRPIFLNVGRLAVEKNLEAFLGLDLPGTKVIVGDGPQRAELERRFPDAVFTGARFGEELARHYAAADVFVFPSLTDTFGNVLLEALACGTPVAAFPVPGPLDVIGESGAGVLDEDLGKAATAALDIPREAALHHAAQYSWDECVRVFLEAGMARTRTAAAG
jgi:glycosyltransferase involved in cell wall biosynthesis